MYKPIRHWLALLLAAAAMLNLFVLPAGAESSPALSSLVNAATASLVYDKSENLHILNKSTGGTFGGCAWIYTTDTGVTGPGYCVNYNLTGAPNKVMPVEKFSGNPKTMGAFANGYPQRTLAQFKELHKDDVRGVDALTELEYAYATQVAVWSTCGQVNVPGTAFTQGTAAVVVPTSDAQQIRVYDSVKAILNNCGHWTKQIYTGMYIRGDKETDMRTVEIIHKDGLIDAAEKNLFGLKKETINGTEYCTRVMYVASATSTYIDGYKTKVYSTDVPAGTIFVAENNSALETVQENGATCYKVDTSEIHNTSCNANGQEFVGAFKVCIPVENAAEEGAFTIHATGGSAQFGLYLAKNGNSFQQSYIIAEPAYTQVSGSGEFKWSKDTTVETGKASLQVNKVGPGGSPLKDAEFTLTGSGGTTVSGKTDGEGRIVWKDLPANESYTLEETKAPEGYQIVEPVNITLTASQTKYVTVRDNTDHIFKIKKIDAKNGASLQGAVFLFEQIDGSYKTTGTTGFDGTIQFSGDELPYGSYRVTEQTPPEGYLKDTRVETVNWDGTRDVTLTFENVPDTIIIISKVDGVSGISLPNAIFRVYKDGSLIDTVTTDNAGEARLTIQGEGYYEVEEITAPEGYVLDPSRHGIYVDPYNPMTEEPPVLTVRNYNKPGLRILKIDKQTGNPLSNVTFKIYKDNELFDTRQTDANGEIFLTDVEPGTYRVEEILSNDEHVLNSVPQEIELRSGQQETVTLVFDNSKKPGIHLIKVDSVTMKSLPNVRFLFKKVGGSYQQEFTTDINGEIDLSKLEPGAYEVTELEAPDGYLIDDAVRVVQVNPDEDASFVFTNTPKPTLRLVKNSSDGSPLGGVHFRIAKIEDGTHYLDRITDQDGEINISDLEPGVYSVKETATVADHILDLQEYHVELFPGQTSTITIENQKRPNLIVYKKDADTGDPIPGTIFTVRAVDGHSVDEIKTDANGRATLDNLLPGVYEISEKSVPAPWLMDAPSQQVTLYPNRDHTVYFENHKKPTLTVNKVDSITGSPIKGAKFEVWYGSNSTNTGELNSLGTFFSDENGQFFVDLLRDGWYKVTELEPAAGYTIKEPTSQEFYIKGGESKVITFENVPKNAIICEKYDSVTGEALPGCTFQLKYLGGTSGTGGTVIGTKVTGKNGTAIWTGLNPGAYVLEEVDAADGYNIIQSSETIMLADSGEQSVVTVKFTNAPDGQLLIRKVCSVNPSVTLQNAEFKIAYADGTLIGDSNGVYRTDENGEIRIPGLTPGKSVVVTETRAPAGFILDTQSQTVQIKEGRTVSLTFKNQPKGAIIIQKRDSQTNQPLPGAEFRVTTAAGCEVGLDGVIGTSSLTQNGIFTTDNNREIRISNLAPGAYVLTETKAPDGYVMDAPSTNVVIGQGGDTQTVVITNSPKATLTILKRDSVTRKPLAKAEFMVKDSEGRAVGPNNGRYITGTDGTVTVSGLEPGATIMVSESKAPTGYILNETPQSIVVKSGISNSLTFDDEPGTSLIIHKYIEGTENEPLSGVAFKVVDGSGAAVGPDDGTYYTDEAGEIVLDGIESGTTVIAREIKTVDGFILDGTPQDILIKAGEVQQLTFWNKRAGTLLIEKLDSITKAPLAGAQFKVLYADGRVVDTEGGKLSSNGIYTTDQNGQIKITQVTGTLVVTEEKAPDGYVMDPNGKSQTVVVNPQDTQTLCFYNEPLCSLMLTKLDSVSGKPVPGTQFTVRDGNGNMIGQYTTGKDGTVTVTGLIPGAAYVVSETKVPSGYVLNPTPQTIVVKNGANTISSGSGLTFENDPKTTLVIEKYVTGTTDPLKGVTFLVTDSNGQVIGSANGEYVTDENGRIVIEGLEPDVTVNVKEIKTLEGYVLDTTPKSIKIKAGEAQTLRFYNQKQGTIVVKKLDKQTGEPLTGVEFQITYSDGSYVDFDNGHMSSKGLYKTDANGEIRISGVVGTLVITETKPLPGYMMEEGTKTQTVRVNPTDTQTITVYNTKVGGLTIIKTDEETGERISGVQFEIRKLSGEIVGTYTTDRTGVISLPEAEKGWYQVTELKAAKGYQLDSQPYQIEVKDGGTATLEITNRQTGSAIIHKIDSVTGKGIYGVKFLLSDAKGNPVGTYESDNEGYVYVDGGLADGKYTIREIECADGYILDTQPKTIYVEYGGCTTITWKNTAVTGQIQVTKTSADYNSMNGWPADTPIPGTVFEIYHYRTGNLVDTIRTDKNGVAVSKPLPLGRYKVVESQAADFYGLDKTPIDVEIEHEGQIVKAAMTNKSLYTNVSIEKTGYAEVMPGQNIRYTFSNIGNNSTTALTSFYWRDTLPVEAVRLAKITTGTYNAVGSYKIVYKTNLSGADYRVLADNLNAQQSYVLEASPVALRLASNEYVTEVMFVFGVVPVNFRQVEVPIMDCTVVSWAKGGSQFVNQADVGGVYNGQWVMATTRWVTKVYAPTKPLPRTGY